MFNPKFWLKFSLVNLLIVASLGVLLRYKIGFDFPYFDQRSIHHAHSHFAFIGWVTHTIFVFIIAFVEKNGRQFHSQYKSLLIANLFAAYGLLFSFFFLGDGMVTSLFILLTIIIAGIFTFFAFKDFNKMNPVHPSIEWFKTALIFNLISYVGVIYEVFLLFNRSNRFNEKLYLASEYFYLHFQYNGFFTFACFALAINKLIRILPGFVYNKLFYRLFLASVIPAYFLSTLWANLPVWLYCIVIVAAITQLYAWLKFANEVRVALKKLINPNLVLKLLFLFIAIAYTIKLTLQLGSTIPTISKLAFGFRHIVIAYLHLILLAVISVFLLTYMVALNIIQNNKRTLFILIVFLAGVFLNEVVLAIQGIASFRYISIPWVNEILFGVTLLIFTGALFLAKNIRKKPELFEI